MDNTHRGIFLGIFLLAAASAVRAGPALTRVDTAGDVGAYSSLQLNAGNPVVSYYDGGQGDLKLATCTGGCAGPSPNWVVVTVDSTGNVGQYTSMALDAGKPVIAYYDVTRGALKMATCTAACATASPTWVITTVDATSGDTGRFPSVLLAGGNPVIAYRDRNNGTLRFAACTAACATATPSWIFTIVDASGDAGRFTSMQLDAAGRPVIAYFDHAHGTVKVASCTAGCFGTSPSWVIAVVDTVPNEDETKLSLALADGNPVVSYYDAVNLKLWLATCTAACGTSSPTWTRTLVDPVGQPGVYSSLQLRGGKPVIAYHAGLMNCMQSGSASRCLGAFDLRLAACIEACASAAPRWVITTIDNNGSVGWDPALVVEGDRGFASYYDIDSGDLKVAAIDLVAASTPQNYTAMWWNPAESGWGVNLTHEGDVVFGSLFSYDGSGNPMWLFMPAGAKQSNGSYSGELYRATGPAFNAKPFTPIGPANLTPVGTMTVTFAGDTASLAYVVDGAEVHKTIKKFVFGAQASTCVSTGGDRKALANYQDLWWNAAESGWGLVLTHQGDTMFATLFTYDAAGRALWLMAPALAKQPAGGGYLGDLYRTTGPPFSAVPFTPITSANVVKVGTMQLRFADGESGTLSYSVDGAAVDKAITRDAFAAPVVACTG